MAETVIFAEQTLTFDGTDPVAIELSSPLVVGQDYGVIWDGTAYTSTAAELDGAVFIGNASMSGIDGMNDTGEPFAVAYFDSGCMILTLDAGDHTVAIYQVVEDSGETEGDTETEEGIILKDRKGEDVAYYGIETLTVDTTTEGKQQTYTKGVAVEGLEIVPDFSGGDMAITAPEDTLVKSATIVKPADLAPENVRVGKTIAGFAGELVPAPDNPYIEYTLNDAGEPIAAKMYGYTSIPTGCFAYMASLESVDLTESPNITSIGGSAFRGCSAITQLTIPDTVKSIGEYAFYECTGLTSITIPAGVTSIGQRAFQLCSNLMSITIPDTVESIGASAFTNCNALTSITIPASVTSIGINAFYGCNALTSFTWPASVTSIGGYMFQQCKGLKSITIPDTVTSIGQYAFNYCTALTSITIPATVTSIGKSAFNSCTALTSITIPASVTSIGINAFYNCTVLTSATFKITTGWWRTTSDTATSGTTISSSYLANKSTAATYLRSTYAAYNWNRS